MNEKTQKLVSFMKNQGVSYPLWNSYLFGVKFELGVLPSKLERGESIRALIPCKYKGHRSLAVVTSMRMLVLNQGMFGRFSNNQADSIYFKQSSGSASSGSLISKYSISTTGEGNDMDITNLWFKDLDRLDLAYNNARQSYEEHANETKRYQNKAESQTYSQQNNSRPNLSPYGLTRNESFILDKQRLKDLLDKKTITLAEFKILNDDIDRKAAEYDKELELQEKRP